MGGVLQFYRPTNMLLDVCMCSVAPKRWVSREKMKLGAYTLVKMWMR